MKRTTRNQAPSNRYARFMEKAQRVDGDRSLGVSNSYKGLRCIPRYLRKLIPIGQIQCDVVDQGITAQSGSEALELYVLSVNNGYFNITPEGSSNIIQGGLTSADIADIVSTPIPVEQAHVVHIGGDFFGSIKDFARNLAPVGRKVYNLLSSAGPYADMALKSLGAGMTAGGRKKGLKHMSM
jgi:hypothetical protein